MKPSINSEPIVVFYKSALCGHCTTVSAIWDNPQGINQDSIVTSLKKVYPKIRTKIVTAANNSGQFDEKEYPKDIRRYAKWFPMFLLVPGPIWDNAMVNLGTNNDAQVLDGVQILNGKMVNNIIERDAKYDIMKPLDFGKWLQQALNDPSFRKVQDKPIVPTVKKQLPIAQPLITPITKPKNTNTSYISTDESTGSICSMRIITRPR